MSTHITYSCAPSIVWVKQTDVTLLVNRATGETWPLNGRAALTWDWLAVGYSQTQIVSMLSLTFSISADEARTTLQHLLHVWHAAGILLAEPVGEGIVHG